MTLIGTQLFYGQKPTWRVSAYMEHHHRRLAVVVGGDAQFQHTCGDLFADCFWYVLRTDPARLAAWRKAFQQLFLVLLLVHAALTLLRGGFALVLDETSA
jgi:hypothetical protein